MIGKKILGFVLIILAVIVTLAGCLVFVGYFLPTTLKSISAFRTGEASDFRYGYAIGEVIAILIWATLNIGLAFLCWKYGFKWIGNKKR